MTTPTNIASTNWSGAVITAAKGKSFSTVSAQWVVPTVSQVPIKGVTLSDVAEWVGIDGYQSRDVCQAGIMETVQTSANGQTTISCSAFDEWYPAFANIIPATSFQVNPGDTIKITVETTGAGATKATFIFDDETTGKIYDVSLTAPRGTSLKGNSAEVVVETPELISGNQVSQPLLSDFLGSPVVFQDVSAHYKGGLAANLSSAQSIGMWTDNVPGGSDVQEAYGGIRAGSRSVTVTENDYWPDASSDSSTIAHKIALLGNYIASSFATASDNHGGTIAIAEASQTQNQLLLTHPQHA
jgi:Peptidase A4 family